MESYGELWRAQERYRDVWRGMGKKLLIIIKHDQTRATESYGELW